MLIIIFISGCMFCVVSQARDSVKTTQALEKYYLKVQIIMNIIYIIVDIGACDA